MGTLQRGRAGLGAEVDERTHGDPKTLSNGGRGELRDHAYLLDTTCRDGRRQDCTQHFPVDPG